MDGFLCCSSAIGQGWNPLTHLVNHDLVKDRHQLCVLPPLWCRHALINKDWLVMTREAHMIEMLECTKWCGHLEVDWHSSIRLGYCQLRKAGVTYCMLARELVRVVLWPFLACSLARPLEEVSCRRAS
jgi:hypothetical protein